MYYSIDLFKRGIFEAVEHRYMVCGHSYLENDRDFGLIEKRKRCSMVLLPQEWVPVLESANQTNPFKVQLMEHGDFKDWMTYLQSKYHLPPKDTDGDKVRFQKSTRFNIGWGVEVDAQMGVSSLNFHPDQLWVKKTHDLSQPWQKVPIKELTASSSRPHALYTAPIRLKPAKVEDLKKIARKHVPEPQRSFYLALD